MNKKNIAAGIVHVVPEDIRKAIVSTTKVRVVWDSLTPIARNEWICWIDSAKKVETRSRRIKRLPDELLNGKRRPCCWPGCSHR